MSRPPIDQATVTDMVTSAAERAAERHPRFADVVRAELGDLHEQLQRTLRSVHTADSATTAPLPAGGWQDYVNTLDHGLSELQVEIDRSAERPETDDQQVRAALTLRCRALALLTRQQIEGQTAREASRGN